MQSAEIDSSVMASVRSRMQFSPSPPPLQAIDPAKEPTPLRARRFDTSKRADNAALKVSTDAFQSIQADSKLQAEKKKIAEQPAENDRDSAEAEVGRITRSKAILKEMPIAIESKAIKEKTLPKKKTIENEAIANAEVAAIPKAKVANREVAEMTKAKVANREVAEIPAAKVANREVAEISAAKDPAVVKGREEVKEPIVSMGKTLKPIIKVPLAQKESVKSKKTSKVPWAEIASSSAPADSEKKKGPSSDTTSKPIISKAGAVTGLAEFKEMVDKAVEGKKKSEQSLRVKKSQLPVKDTIQSTTQVDTSYSFFDNSVAISVASSPRKFAAQNKHKDTFQYEANDDDDDDLGYVYPSQQSTPHGKKQIETIGDQVLGPILHSVRQSSPSADASKNTSSNSTSHNAKKKVPMESTPIKGAPSEKQAVVPTANVLKKSIVMEIEDDTESDEEPIQLSTKRSSNSAKSIDNPIRSISNVADLTINKAAKEKSRPKPRPAVKNASEDQPRPEIESKTAIKRIANTQPAQPKSLPPTGDLFGFALAEQSVKELRKEKGMLLQRKKQSIPIEEESQTQQEGQFSMIPSSTVAKDVPVDQPVRDESLPPLDFSKRKGDKSSQATKKTAISEAKISKNKKKDGNDSSSNLSDYESELDVSSWGGKSGNEKKANGRGKKDDSQAIPKTMQDVLRYSMIGGDGTEEIDTALKVNNGKGKAEGGKKSAQDGAKLNLRDSTDSSFKVDAPIKGRALHVDLTPIPTTTKAKINKKGNQAAKRKVTVDDEDDYDLPPGMTRPAAKKGRASSSSAPKSKTAAKKVSNSTVSASKSKTTPKASTAGANSTSASKSNASRPKPRPLATRNSNQGSKETKLDKEEVMQESLTQKAKDFNAQMESLKDYKLPEEEIL